MTTDAGTDAASATDQGTDTNDQGTDTAAEIAKWKALSQKHEERAKSNAAAAKELESFKQQTMTDTEKAVQAARLEGRTEGVRTASEKIARAEIRAAAAGRNVNVDALLEGIDPTRFLDDEGEPDTKAIAAWMDKIAPVGDEKPRGPRDLGQGVRGGQAPPLNGDPLVKSLTQLLGG